MVTIVLSQVWSQQRVWYWSVWTLCCSVISHPCCQSVLWHSLRILWVYFHCWNNLGSQLSSESSTIVPPPYSSFQEKMLKPPVTAPYWPCWAPFPQTAADFVVPRQQFGQANGGDLAKCGVKVQRADNGLHCCWTDVPKIIHIRQWNTTSEISFPSSWPKHPIKTDSSESGHHLSWENNWQQGN